MNKRKIKKRYKLIKKSDNLGFYHMQKYRKIREVYRNYHEYLICCNRTERSIDDFIKELY